MNPEDWEREDLNVHSFIEHYIPSLDNLNTHLSDLILLIYFTMTTLSTVGLGDIHPKSDSERAFTIVIFISGVSIYSYIMGNLIEILQCITQLQAEPEEDEKLSQFLNLLSKFNNNIPINKEFKDKMVTFIEFCWTSDKNFILKSEEGQLIVEQLSEKVRTNLITQFLQKDFIIKYYKFFRIRGPNDVFYTWLDSIYRNFMLDILDCLEPRYLYKNEIIFDEL